MNSQRGTRTHDHKIKSLALYHLSYEGLDMLVMPRILLPVSSHETFKKRLRLGSNQGPIG